MIRFRAGILAAAVSHNELDDAGDPVVGGLRVLEKAFDLSRGSASHFEERGNQRQRDFVLPQILAGGLARDIGGFRIVKEIIGDLEGHSKGVPVGGKLRAIRGLEIGRASCRERVWRWVGDELMCEKRRSKTE